MRDKQIEEMVKHCHFYEDGNCILCEELWVECDAKCDMCEFAKQLYNAGYLKAEDVVREVFNDIENALFSSYYKDEIEDSILSFTLNKLNEAKHKYLNEDFFVKMTGFSEPPIPHTIESIADLAFPESEEER